MLEAGTGTQVELSVDSSSFAYGKYLRRTKTKEIEEEEEEEEEYHPVRFGLLTAASIVHTHARTHTPVIDQVEGALRMRNIKALPLLNNPVASGSYHPPQFCEPE